MTTYWLGKRAIGPAEWLEEGSRCLCEAVTFLGTTSRCDGVMVLEDQKECECGHPNARPPCRNCTTTTMHCSECEAELIHYA